MQLAIADLFQARWTDEIHDEWTRNVLANRPDVRPESVARCRELMDSSTAEARCYSNNHCMKSCLSHQKSVARAGHHGRSRAHVPLTPRPRAILQESPA